MIIRPKSPSRRGVAMVESAVGLVILLVVIFGIIEYGQLIMARQLMNNAARSAARAASAGRQPATYLDGTGTPSPGGVITTSFLNTWITKALAPAPVSSPNPQFYGSNPDGSANSSIAWDSTAFGQGFYIDLRATYIPLFSGNRLLNGSANSPIVGSVGLRSLVFIRAEANN